MGWGDRGDPRCDVCGGTGRRAPGQRAVVLIPADAVVLDREQADLLGQLVATVQAALRPGSDVDGTHLHDALTALSPTTREAIAPRRHVPPPPRG